MNKDLPLVVAYGGGVNSTAMLVEFHKRGIRPDATLFADTGGERPETMCAIKQVSAWCVERGMPEIVMVRYPGGPHGDKSLEAECLRTGNLPSIAYGFKTCSDKWKRTPQDKYLKANGLWPCKKAIGYDAGEERRMKPSQDEDVVNWFPLIEWGFWREECEAVCTQAGLPIAKSSCFYCPSMKKREILDLAKTHPDLAARACAMEANAAPNLITVNGLGRNFSWTDFLKADAEQGRLFPDDPPETPCGCYDG